MDLKQSKETGTVEMDASKRRPVLGLLAVLAVALGLRLWGIGWGLPNAQHYFSYHPDENTVLFYAMTGINLFGGKLLPGFYRYGSLQLYLINFTNTLAYLFGGVAKITWTAIDFSKDDSWGRMLLIGRMLAVAMGTWTVGLTYAIGRRLWSTRAGVIAAMLLAVMPLHVQHSHWLVVDVPTTFWIMLSIYWSTRLTEIYGSVETLKVWQQIKPAVFAGLAAGFACATKYNAVLVMLPVLHAAWPGKKGDGAVLSTRRQSTWAVCAIVACVVAFLIGCPGSLLDNKQFMHDVAAESKHVSAQPDEPFMQTGSGFVYEVTTNLYFGMGLPLLLVSLASLVYAGMRRGRQDGLLAVFAFPYYALLGFAVVRYARYAIPLLPILALWSGRMLDDLWSSAKASTARLSAALTVVTVASTALLGVYYVLPMSTVDPRDRASNWIADQGLSGQTIGFARAPWFWTPSVDPAFCWFMPNMWRQWPFNPPGWESRFIYRQDWDMSMLDVDKPAVIVLSQYEYKDAIRLKEPAAMTFIARLQQDYKVGREFGGYWKAEIGPSGPPHDMMYTDPATWVFIRR